MSRTRRGSFAGGTAALAALAALSTAGGAGAAGLVIPNCTPVTNLEAIIDDSGSMASTDFNKLRVTGMELFITNQGNQKKGLGAVEFGSTANTVFPPAVVANNRNGMINALRAQVNADNGGTDYNSGFIKAGQDNPGAKARIFLTDGADNGGFTDTHRGGPPTFVVGLGIGKAGIGNTDADRLGRIASETGGSYYPDVTAATVQPTFNAISSRVNCLVPPKTFTSKLFTRKGQKSTRTTGIHKSAKSMDIVLNWAQPTNRFVISGVAALNAKNKVLATLTGKGKPKKIVGQKRAKGTTFRSLSMRKPKGTKKLKFTVKVATIFQFERTITQVGLRVGG
jgi:hypothetical protein